MRLRLTLEYDGTPFCGWAVQPGLTTVEGTLREALGATFRSFSGLAVAGRTDTGVHALGQVVSVDVVGGPPLPRVAEALTTALPTTVSILSADETAPDFHARHSARSRTYRYRIWRRRTPSPFEQRRSWWLSRQFDEASAAESAALVVGEHDFRAFTPTETQHEGFVRVVESAAWNRDGDTLSFEITANSYLRHMVRTLVGTMVELPPERIAELLRGGPRSEAGATAPPWGLYLVSIAYDEERPFNPPKGDKAPL